MVRFFVILNFCFFLENDYYSFFSFSFPSKTGRCFTQGCGEAESSREVLCVFVLPVEIGGALS